MHFTLLVKLQLIASGLVSRVTGNGLEDGDLITEKQGIFSATLGYKSVRGCMMWTRTRKTKQPIPLADPSSSSGISRTLSGAMKRLRPP